MLNDLAPVLGIRNPRFVSSAFDPHMGVFIDAQDKYDRRLLFIVI
jgi:vacuolar protein sorting-associated protein 53